MRDMFRRFARIAADAVGSPRRFCSGQNRDAKVMQLKLDQLIRSVTAARTELVQMEGLTDLELDELQKEFQLHRDRTVGNLERIAASRESRRSLRETNS